MPGFYDGVRSQALFWVGFAKSPEKFVGLADSGSNPLFPVIARPGGTPWGQNRDNYWKWLLSLLVVMGTITTAISPTLAVSAGDASEAEDVHAAIDRVYEDYLRTLPHTRPVERAAIYARYSTKFQDSLVDQVREILAWTASHELFVPR